MKGLLIGLLVATSFSAFADWSEKFECTTGSGKYFATASGTISAFSKYSGDEVIANFGVLKFDEIQLFSYRGGQGVKPGSNIKLNLGGYIEVWGDQTYGTVKPFEENGIVKDISFSFGDSAQTVITTNKGNKYTMKCDLI